MKRDIFIFLFAVVLLFAGLFFTSIFCAETLKDSKKIIPKGTDFSLLLNNPPLVTNGIKVRIIGRNIYGHSVTSIVFIQKIEE